MKSAPINNFIISNATASDFIQIQAIYEHYVLNETATFEEIPPSAEEMIVRWKASAAQSLPYIVAKNGETILGYAYAFPYRPRTAYRFTLEESVYVAKEYHGLGLGKLLLGEVINNCSIQGYKQMLAVIAGTNNTASIKFHENLGFKQSGIIENVGLKFDRWIDTIIMQKSL